MRTFIIVVLVLFFSFSLAPSVLAQTGGASGSRGEVTTGGTTGGPSGGTTGVSGGQSGNTSPGTNITLINPLNTGECAPNGNCLMNFLNKILEFVIQIGTVVVVLMTVYVGYLFVAAQGNSTKIEEAKKALLWTVVGALILLGSQAIAVAIRATVQAISVGQ